MSFGPTSPLTGASETDLTSPTYTLVSDTGPNAHSEQYAVTTLGGTQTGVLAHSVSNPFTLTFERPAQFRSIGQANPITGVISNVPMNVYKCRVRKGLIVDATSGQTRIGMVETRILVPAGADVADPVSLQAMQSCAFGALWDGSTGIGDTTIDGVL